MHTEGATDLAGVVAAINARHGTRFALGARYHAGTQGAHALTDDTGARFVLKTGSRSALQRFSTVAMAAERLRDDGYPAPYYRFTGETTRGAYAVLDILPGEPLVMLSASLLADAFALNARQVGRAVAGPRDWPRVLIETTLHGGNGYCELSSLRTHSAETAALLTRCQTAARAALSASCVADDIVHYDFNPTNILSAAGRITGVVDWEGTCAGDCAFDLATLLFFAYDSSPARMMLGAHLRQRLDPRIAALSFAHLIVRQVDWAIRHDDAGTVARWIETAHAVAADFLPLS